MTGTLAALALGAMPAAASADGLNLGLNGCPAQTIEHPFARWLDNANYVLAPGGTFEGAMDGWKLTGGAKVVAGSESFAAHGAGREERAVAAVRQLGDDAPGVRRRARSDDALLRGERRRSAVAA